MRRLLDWLLGRRHGASLVDETETGNLTGDLQRPLFSLALALVSLGLGFFALDDLTDGRTVEGSSTLALALVLAAAVVMVPRVRRIEPLCRLSIGLGVGLLLYEMAVGGGGGLVFVWFFVLPLCVYFLLGKDEGTYWVVAAGLAAGVLFFVNVEGLHHYDVATGVRFLFCFAISSVLSYGLESSRSAYHGQLLREKQAVAGALSQVETLRGLLPMCAACKSVRDDEGYWSRIERYLAKHSLADLVHALCPQCGGDAADRPRPSPEPPPAAESALGGLFSWIEKRFLAAGLPREELRHRAQFSLLIVVVAPILTAYGIEDLLSGRVLNGAFDLLLTAFMLRALHVLVRTPDARPVYRLFAGLVLVALFFELDGGEAFAFLWVYPLPGVAMVLLGHREGLAWSAATLAVTAVPFLGPVGHSYELSTGTRMLVTFTVVTVLSFGFELSRARSYRRLSAEKKALESALDRVATLRGLLPICPQCKKVRDDRGQWQDIEPFVGERTGGSFSHGLCPECLEELYNDLDDGLPGSTVAAGASTFTAPTSSTR